MPQGALYVAPGGGSFSACVAAANDALASGAGRPRSIACGERTLPGSCIASAA
jgi:hypothetical protein